MVISKFKLSTVSLTLLSLFGCGGGSDSEPNQPPSLSQDSFNIEFNQATEITLSATDHENDPLTISITSQPTNGSLEAVSGKPFTFLYSPNSDSTLPDGFSVSISDGELSTAGNINLAIVDTSAPTIYATKPETNDIRVAIDSELTVTFDDIMNSVDSSTEGECVGVFQLSRNNFSSCIALEISSQNRRTFTLKPNDNESGGLWPDHEYSLRISEGMANFHGTTIEPQVISTFATEYDNLRITEFSTSRYSDDNRWIEIYNGTASEVNLSDFSIHTGAVDLDTYELVGEQYFQLANKTIKPGEFIVAQGRFGNGYWQSSVAESDQLILIGNAEDNIRPYWDDNGFIELLTSNHNFTVDFVRFGTSEQSPISDHAWDNLRTINPINTSLGSSMVRNLEHRDRDVPEDWTFTTFMTPGGINDVTGCIEDNDNDGIPDCAERENSTFAGLPLYSWGARENQKDIFIEVDYMASEDSGVTPHRESLEKVVNAFAAEGYSVHFDVGNLFHNAEGISPENMDMGGGSEIPFYLQTLFTSSETAPSILDHKIRHTDLRRKPIFHYMLMANSQEIDGSAGSSGYAEINGNDFFISMGNWGLSLENEPSRNLTFNMQAATIMHELGHNLGLLHGGDENVNEKPNHLSVMNYTYQLNGLPTIGSREGDRYYQYFYRDNLNCNLESNLLQFGPEAPLNLFKMNYSEGKSASINEAAVIESIGFGYSNSSSIDFDCNGLLDTSPYSMDINFDGRHSVLNDVDEWSLVSMIFHSTWSGNVSGSNRSPQLKTLSPSNVMNNDVQKLVQEQTPNDEIFKKIRALKND